MQNQIYTTEEQPSTERTTSPILNAARVYARAGFRVLPVEPNGKRPLLKNWPELATNDVSKVDELFSSRPNANIGGATGGTLFVLDVDPKNGGDETLAGLIAKHGPLPVTPTQRTPSGGFHHFFAMPDFHVGNATNVGKLKGLDIRGVGGQVVLAPSRTDVGEYQWIESPFTTPLANAPDWLLEILRGAVGVGTKSVDGSQTFNRHDWVDELQSIPDGTRDDTIFRAACALARAVALGALAEDLAWVLLCALNEARCVPPLSPTKLEAKAKQASRYARGNQEARDE